MGAVIGLSKSWAGRLAAVIGAAGHHPVHAVVHAVVLAATTPAASFVPTSTKLPGGAVLQTLVDGLGGWALTLALAGLVVGAALWAVGSHSQNYQQSFVGKRAVLVSGFAALIVGAAPAIIDFFFHTGLHVKNPLA
ncbi:MAG: hypothetical protein ACRDWE_03290 [Acidimicrobiales bacterium]